MVLECLYSDFKVNKFVPEITLDPHACHLWFLNIRSLQQICQDEVYLLSENEIIRSSRFIREDDCTRYKLGRIMVRKLIAKLLSIEASEVMISAGSNNKPVLDPQFSSNLHFNISHSGDYVTIAISDSPVGVDIEHMSRNITILDFLPNCFNEDESAFIINSKDPKNYFFLLWTRKEALLKANGSGLIEEMPQIPSLDGIHHIVRPDLIKLKQNYRILSSFYETHYAVSLGFGATIENINFWKF